MHKISTTILSVFILCFSFSLSQFLQKYAYLLIWNQFGGDPEMNGFTPEEYAYIKNFQDELHTTELTNQRLSYQQQQQQNPYYKQNNSVAQNQLSQHRHDGHPFHQEAQSFFQKLQNDKELLENYACTLHYTMVLALNYLSNLRGKFNQSEEVIEKIRNSFSPLESRSNSFWRNRSYSELMKQRYLPHTKKHYEDLGSEMIRYFLNFLLVALTYIAFIFQDQFFVVAVIWNEIHFQRKLKPFLKLARSCVKLTDTSTVWQELEGKYVYIQAKIRYSPLAQVSASGLEKDFTLHAIKDDFFGLEINAPFLKTYHTNSSFSFQLKEKWRCCNGTKQLKRTPLVGLQAPPQTTI